MKKTIQDEPVGLLQEYRRKRNFSRTSEPAPANRICRKKSVNHELLFVIQKHDATRLHYDFRLEMDGVLKSWAVPKGVPFKKGEKHLAVHVEDHPMDYARFEGTIPSGSYGAGTVMVWDIGTYTVKGADPIKALEAGKLHVILKGKKLNGEWALIRMKQRSPSDKDNWLIFKAAESMRPLSVRKDDESALSGRSMRCIAEENRVQWKSDRTAAPTKNVEPRISAAVEKRKRLLASRKTGGDKPQIPPNLPKASVAFIEPMKCKPVKKPPRGKEWIYEIKFDGYRVIALKNGGKVQLLSRSRKPFDARFPEIVKAIVQLPAERAVLDGEIVALDEDGRSSFQLLQLSGMPGEPRGSICFYAFDLLNLEGKSLVSLPLKKRKEMLRQLLPTGDDLIRFSANIHGDPDRLLEEVRNRGLEGIVAKNWGSSYEAGQRSGNWKKIKVINSGEFVIGGYTEPKGSRDFFGAILVGHFEGNRLVYVSKVGSGFNEALLASLHGRFEKIRCADCPFVNLPEMRRGRYGQGITRSEMKRCRWIEPKLVCQVSYTEWTRDNHLRHPVFLGIREDKTAGEVSGEI